MILSSASSTDEQRCSSVWDCQTRASLFLALLLGNEANMDSSEVLTTLILCGFMGALGQGVRAAVGLKSAATLGAQNPRQQTEFDVAYFTLSLMIGFTAGLLAGFTIGLEKFAKIDPNNPKLL